MSLIAKIAGKISTPLLLKRTKPLIIHPFYHSVTNLDPLHIKPLYTPRRIWQFKTDLDFLCRYFRPISIDEVLYYSTHPGELSDNCFHLSFDDGLSEVYNCVYPILKERNIPATIFINNEFVDNKALFYRHQQAILYVSLFEDNRHDAARKALAIPYTRKEEIEELVVKEGIFVKDFLEVEKPYLTMTELKELEVNGFTIAAHGVDHTPFKLMTKEEQIGQIEDSCRYVEEHFSTTRRYFSFPFSDEGLESQLFNELFTDNKVDLTFGITGIGSRYNHRHIGRIIMEQCHLSAKEIVNSALLKYIKRNA